MIDTKIRFCCIKLVGRYCDVTLHLTPHSTYVIVQDWRECVKVDGLHLSKRGGLLLADLLKRKLDVITNLRQLYPEYNEINNNQPDLIKP